MSFKRFAPPPYVMVQPLDRVPDPRGEHWGFVEGPVGEPFEAKARKLTTTEKFEFAATTTSTYYRLWTDAPAPVSESVDVWMPADTEEKYDVKSVVPYPERGVVEIEIERTN